MDLYRQVSYELSRILTLRYSSSFGISSRLFSASIRHDIYAIYGLVRVADEIVDSYAGSDQESLLDNLEKETHQAMIRGYSANPIIHAFALTATRYAISNELIGPFFASMRMDLSPRHYDDAQYKTYIHGSAEVIGLMCLRVFCEGNQAQYDSLAPGASALGSAYQKVNFLRDIAADYTELNRLYFPGIDYDQLNDDVKNTIVADIEADFAAAEQSLRDLPRNSRAAVMTSAVYYKNLLARLKQTPASSLKTRRLRVPMPVKLWLLAITALRYKVSSS